jgi:peptidoglycan/xylan/chitin deacetylase (PgdA/CDA1 family)
MFSTIRLSKKVAAVCLAVVLAAACWGVWKIGIAGPAAAASVQKREDNTSIQLPVIMYHGMLKEASRSGKYVISPTEFENDLKCLQKLGYTPVHMEEVLKWWRGEGTLPEKPIILSFDDGYYNNYLYAYPLAKQYNMKILISPIGYYTDRYSEVQDEHANYSHMTWDEIKEMMDSGLVEFQNHTYNLHANKGGRLGARKLRGESIEQYRKILTEDVTTLQEKFKEHTGYEPQIFVFPFGAMTDSAVDIVKEMGFQGIFTCESRMNTLVKGEKEALYRIGRYLRPSGVDSESYFTKTVKLS